MAKFNGIIGFAMTVEKAPGVWVDDIVEKAYTGDIIRDIRRWGYDGNVNPSLNVSENISIIADSFVLNNMHTMKYVKWLGASWQIQTVEIKRPRIIIWLGGVYNGGT